MNYLIVKKDCVFLENKLILYSGAKYILEEIDNKEHLLISKDSGEVFCLNFYEVIYKNKKYSFVENLKVDKDNYIVVSLSKDYLTHNFQLEVFKKNLSVFITDKISINFNNEILNIEKENNVLFSCIEYFGKIAIVFFEGERNFAIVIKEDEILFSNYYDEINIGKENCTLMSKHKDSLNHGTVVNIEKDQFESYLVYLDNYDLNLKSQFCICVFLDCILSGNFVYIKNLLNENLKNEQDSLKEFLVDIKEFYPIEPTKSFVIKKDARLDILEFDIDNLQIQNIFICD